MENETKLFIKGMVCNRCVMIVKDELQGLGHAAVQVELGVVKLADAATEFDRAKLQQRLTRLGFDLLEDPKRKLAEEVKALVKEVYSGGFAFPDRFRFSFFAKERLNKDDDSISDLFIAFEKKTIEQHSIEFRIGKVREYRVCSNATLADLAFRLNFNSPAH